MGGGGVDRGGFVGDGAWLLLAPWEDENRCVVPEAERR